MSIQTDIDSLVGKISVFNLALNVVGIINNKKNVAIYVGEENGTKVGNNVAVSNSTYVKPMMEDILEGSLGRISSITGNSSVLANKIDDTGVIMSADVIENSKLTEHPLEDGKVLADNKVKLPTEIDVQITLPATEYQDRLDKIKQYRDDNTMLTVKTKLGVYKNMQIVSIPCKLNVENISRVTFNLKLREVIVAEDLTNMSVDTVEDVSNATTQDIGYKTGSETEIIYVE